MSKIFKRWLILLHRWLGIVMCLIFALWFASGMVIMYVQYPQLNEAERVQQLKPLAAEQIRISPGEAMHSLGLGASGLRSLRLQQVLGRPAYIMHDMRNRPVTVFADDGQWLPELTPDQALAAVAHSGFADTGQALSHRGLITIDQWSISGNLNVHRPLHLIEVHDGHGTQVYVSSVSGEIVLDSTRHERFWNWLGSTIHWVYPLQLRQHTVAWSNVVITLTLLGMAVVISGGLLGFIRLNLQRHRRQRSGLSPYRGIDRWHHLLGLGSLLFLGSYLFSGLLSMSPWGLGSGGSPITPQLTRYHDLPLRDLRRFPALPIAALDGVREVQWISVGGEGHLLLTSAPGEQQVLLQEAQGLQPAPAPELETRILAAAARLLPEASVQRQQRLQAFDNYYYQSHQRHRPLPAMRLGFDDQALSWFDIDLNSGQIVQRHTRESRRYRWLYNGLHSLDLQYLLARRPLWDLLVLTLNLLGLALSVTAILIGWRRLLRSV